MSNFSNSSNHKPGLDEALINWGKDRKSLFGGKFGQEFKLLSLFILVLLFLGVFFKINYLLFILVCLGFGFLLCFIVWVLCELYL